MKLAKTFLAIGIAIIFTVFIAYGLYAFYEPPKYETNTSMCYTDFNCEKFLEKCMEPKTVPISPNEDCYMKAEQNPEYQKCQEQRDECNDEYKKTTDKYSHARNSFYILLVIGALAIIAGTMLSKLEGIGSGFIGGGVLVVLWALPYTWEYWMELHKYTKVAALFAILALLIYFGYKKLEKRK